jgi:hypothetical protein
MKHISLLTLLLFSFYATAQDKISFDYDAAGNQIKRELCITCINTSAKYVSKANDVAKEEFIPMEASGKISCYPNPVQQELYLTWQLTNTTTVTAIEVYDLNGRLLQTYTNSGSSNLQTIPFVSYPQGVYAVVVVYSNGDKKSIKIVKQ